MFRTLASAGLIAAAALGISAASPSKAEAGVLIQQAYYDGPAYGWRPPPAYGYWGVPRWRRHYYGPASTARRLLRPIIIAGATAGER